MKSIIDLENEFKEDIKCFDVKRENPEKFLISFLCQEPENVDLLKKYNIILKPCDWIVLTIEPEILKKNVLRAEELGFLDAYIQTPSFLKQDVDVVLKRMSELEHLGIPYKNEKGKYLPFLFSKRGYEYVLNETGNVLNKDYSNLDIELKELIDRLIESLSLEKKQDEIYNKLSLLEKENFDIRNTLLFIFKEYTDNYEFLNECVDKILGENMNIEKGRIV